MPTDSPKHRLKIGLLGMGDNQNTVKLLRYLQSRDTMPDFAVLSKSNFKGNLRRVTRKLKAAGLMPTLNRVLFALKSRIEYGEPAQDVELERFYVPSHNSKKCHAFLNEQQVDLLIVATDEILTSQTIEIPRIGCLNAHPGTVPAYRGLGGLCSQLRAGFYPSVSVHFVDEGIDTGPVLLRRQFQVDPKDGLDVIASFIVQKQWELMVEVIEKFGAGVVEPEDTLLEPSNMTRGMPLRSRNRLDKDLKAGKVQLKRYPGVDVAED